MEIEKNKELETVQKPTKSKQTKVDKEKEELKKKIEEQEKQMEELQKKLDLLLQGSLISPNKEDKKSKKKTIKKEPNKVIKND